MTYTELKTRIYSIYKVIKNKWNTFDRKKKLVALAGLVILLTLIGL
jgi:hypothetical protein